MPSPLSSIFALCVVSVLLALLPCAYAHAMMTQPQSTAPWTCTLGGGVPELDIPDDNCAGPCDLRAIDLGWANFDRPSRPAAIYERNQKVRVKYTRNNHRSGGFLRLALVKPGSMMDKKAHDLGAFHYSCWGAKLKVASGSEPEEDFNGFNITGNDGEEHGLPAAYFYVDIRIPSYVPDGNYVLGWVWFGGTFGDVTKNKPQRPTKFGYFSDYWSCSYIRVEGGGPVGAAEKPIFRNDMSQFSSKGCRSANDYPGICPIEPCETNDAKYQVPGPFKDEGSLPFVSIQ